MSTTQSKPRTDGEQSNSIRDAVLAEITAATDALRARRPTDRNIHEGRKCIKRARAGLRLLRSELGDATYRRENIELRNVGRTLSKLRDAKILVTALDNLTEHVSAKQELALLRRHRQLLVAEKRRVRNAALKRGGDLSRCRKTLGNILVRERKTPMQPNEWPTLLDGLLRTYRRTRRALKKAKATQTFADRHEWRKQVKYLVQQLEWFKPCKPRAISPVAAQASKIADQLGDDHDLALLMQRFLHIRPWCDSPQMPALTKCLDRERARHASKAYRLGKRLFSKSPAKFAKWIDRCCGHASTRPH